MEDASDDIERRHLRLYVVMRSARTARDEASVNETPLPGRPVQVPDAPEGTLGRLRGEFDAAEKRLREFEAAHGLRRMG